MKQPIELVVFDIAGTTVKDNGEIASAFKSALNQFGYEVTIVQINPLMGYKKTEAIKTILEKQEENGDKISTKLINKIHSRFLEIMVNYYATTPYVTPLPGTEKLFACLRSKKIKIALNTGFSKDITDVIMERLGWIKNQVVDYVISSNEVPAGRPFPFMIEELMHRANIKDAKKLIKIGDTEVDIFEGKNAGCLYSIAVTTGAFTRKELEKYSPSFVIDHLEEILPIIENQVADAGLRVAAQ